MTTTQQKANDDLQPLATPTCSAHAHLSKTRLALSNKKLTSFTSTLSISDASDYEKPFFPSRFLLKK